MMEESLTDIEAAIALLERARSDAGDASLLLSPDADKPDTIESRVLAHILEIRIRTRSAILELRKLDPESHHRFSD